ncbi:hypothetical protein J6590_065484 [Homalodisca vitripennis]|nr:hypothetical protein J6590_065484 [Homalodisca vitripennis]
MIVAGGTVNVDGGVEPGSGLTVGCSGCRPCEIGRYKSARVHTSTLLRYVRIVRKLEDHHGD